MIIWVEMAILDLPLSACPGLYDHAFIAGSSFMLFVPHACGFLPLPLFFSLLGGRVVRTDMAESRDKTSGGGLQDFVGNCGPFGG